MTSEIVAQPASPTALSEGLGNLRVYLDSCTDKVPDRDQILPLLKPIWQLLEGSSDSSMAAWKLDRLSAPRWAPPQLSFEIERHGGTALGSTRAERQYWCLNAETGKLSHSIAGFRQISPRDKPLKVGPLVDEIVAAVQTGSAHPALKWKDPDQFLIKVGVLIPGGSTPKQTLQGRRSRFKDELVSEMKSLGWEAPSRSYNFRKKTDDHR